MSRPSEAHSLPLGPAEPADPALVSKARTPSPELPPARTPAAWLESLRSRVFMKSLDAAYTAPLRGGSPVRAALTGLDPRASHYARVGALVRVAGSLAPGLARGISARLERSARLPLGAPAALLAFGSGATVFRLGGGPSCRALKIYRRSLGRRPANLLAIARTFRRKYATVRSWYDGPTDLLPSAEYLLLHGPLLGCGAVACLQEWIDGEKSDFFRDHSDTHLLGLILEDDELRAAFEHFASRTLHLRDEQGVCVDLLGRDNLMLVRTDRGLRLRLIDYGIFDLEQKRRESPRSHARMCDYLERIEVLLHALR